MRNEFLENKSAKQPMLFLIVFCLLSSCKVNSADCMKFHEGKFKIVDPNSGTTYITRQKDIQIERNTDIGYSLKLKVKWESDCKYTLRIIEILENEPNYPYDSTAVMTVEITRAKENSYFQRTTSNNSDHIFESEVFQIE